MYFASQGTLRLGFGFMHTVNSYCGAASIWNWLLFGWAVFFLGAQRSILNDMVPTSFIFNFSTEMAYHKIVQINISGTCFWNEDCYLYSTYFSNIFLTIVHPHPIYFTPFEVGLALGDGGGGG